MDPTTVALEADESVRRSRRRRWGAALLLGPTAALLLLAACGGGDDKEVTTTTSSVASSTSSSAAPASSTTSQGRTTISIQPTPTEPASTDLADGKHPVYLTAVDTAKRTITVDVVQVLDRRSPESATICPEIASGDIDGYCIKNANTRLRTLSLQAKASLQVLNGSDLRTVDIAGLAAARQAEKELNFFEINLTGGSVTAVKAIYRP